MLPWHNLARLAAGDFLAKTLHFLAFVYLARVLGAAHYGVLEFANSILTYFLLLADGGLEMWATREAAQHKDVQRVVTHVVPLRCGLALGALIILWLMLSAFPEYPYLRTTLVLFGFTLLVQATNLKWVFMGQEKMTRVAVGLALGQSVFA